MLVVEDNPYGLLRFGGEPLPPLYQLDGGDFVIYIGTFSKILSPGIRLGWAVAPPPVMEKIVLGKQAADLCTSTLTQYFVREYFAEGRWRDYIDEPGRDLPRPPRRDARGAAPSTSRPQATWTEPEGGLFIWATLPDYIDTGDLLAKALRDDVAFVPGQAAYVDGRGRNSMRLNFSGVGEDEIREGVRRIGKVIAEQVELYESADRRAGSPGCPAEPRHAASRTPAPTSCRSASAARAAREGRGPQGRPVAGARRLAALGGAGRGRAGAARPRGACRSTSAPTWSSACAPSGPTSPSSPCTGAAARTAPRRSCSRSSASPSPAPASPPARAAWTRSLAKHAMREAGVPTPDWFAFNQTAFRELGAADALGRARASGSASRSSSSRAAAAPRSGSSSPRAAARCPQALVSAFSYDDRVLLERFVEGRELAVSVLGDEPLPVVEAIPHEGDRYDFEARYEIGRTRFVCPAELERRGASARSPRPRSAPTGRSAAPASPAST